MQLPMSMEMANPTTSNLQLASLNGMGPARGRYSYHNTTVPSADRFASIAQVDMMNQMAAAATSTYPTPQLETPTGSSYMMHECGIASPAINSHCNTRFQLASPSGNHNHSQQLNSLATTTGGTTSRSGQGSVRSDESDCSEEIIVDDTETSEQQQPVVACNISSRMAAHDDSAMMTMMMRRMHEDEPLTRSTRQMATQRWPDQQQDTTTTGLHGLSSSHCDQLTASSLHCGATLASYSGKSRPAMTGAAGSGMVSRVEQHQHQAAAGNDQLLTSLASSDLPMSTRTTRALASVPQAASLEAQRDDAANVEQQLNAVDQMMIYNSIFASFLSQFASSSSQQQQQQQQLGLQQLQPLHQHLSNSTGADQARLLNVLMMENAKLSFNSSRQPATSRLAASSPQRHYCNGRQEATQMEQDPLQSIEFCKNVHCKQTAANVNDRADLQTKTRAGNYMTDSSDEPSQGSATASTTALAGSAYHPGKSSPVPTSRRFRRSIDCQARPAAPPVGFDGPSTIPRVVVATEPNDNVATVKKSPSSPPFTIWRAFVD